jgi:hypothetical protein
MNHKITLALFQVTLIMIIISGCGVFQVSPTQKQPTPGINTTPVSSPVSKTLTEITNEVQPTSKAELVEGEVLQYHDNTLLIASGNEQISLTISIATSIWEGKSWIADIPVKTGDFATAWGEWNVDHSFKVDKLWINIVNLQGTVYKIEEDHGKTSFYMTDQYKHTDDIVISPLTVIDSLSAGITNKTFRDSHLLPKEGDYVEVIGRENNDGSILAVNISITQ